MKKKIGISHRALQTVIDSVYDAVILHDLDGKIIGVNSKMLDMYRVSHELALHYSINKDYSGPNNDMDSLCLLWTKVRNGEPQLFEWEARRPEDNSLFDVEVYLKKIKLDGTDAIVASVRDITESKRVKGELMLAARVYQSILEGILVTDRTSVILSANKALTNITGYSSEELVGQQPNILKSGQHDDSFYQDIWESLAAKGEWEGEIWNRYKDGVVKPNWLSISAIRDRKGKVTNYVGVIRDLSIQKEQEEQIKQYAYYDALTSLPNRRLFQERLTQEIAGSSRDGVKLAVALMDLDGFKLINDSMGHDVGDILLRQVAKRVTSVSRAVDTVARVGGDEFTFIFPQVQEIDQLKLLADRIIEAIEKPCIINDNQVNIKVSIGLCLYPDDAKNIVDLWKAADIAMYRAKDQGKKDGTSNYVFYNEIV
ncbi:MAG: sensor domain-containing diguanylate cyclase [Sporomusaceae bacterium]|nr:sensor domain-containing diguanylate cyclase [Sporomusaceae bacterium]